jgi:hypothetical protein
MDNLLRWNTDIPEALLSEIDESFAHVDIRTVDPRQWPR